MEEEIGHGVVTDFTFNIEVSCVLLGSPACKYNETQVSPSH